MLRRSWIQFLKTSSDKGKDPVQNSGELLPVRIDDAKLQRPEFPHAVTSFAILGWEAGKGLILDCQKEQTHFFWRGFGRSV